MSRHAVAVVAGMAFAVASGVASADPLNLDWVDLNVGTSTSPPGDPSNWIDVGPPSSPSKGQCFYYMIDSGSNSDNNGGGTSHFEIEGVGEGANQGQSWVQWQGMVTGLKADCDAAFGVNAWTISRIWVLYDQASFAFGDGPGLVSFAEVSSQGVQGGLADWGDKTQANAEDGGATTLLPAGYHGFHMGPTAGGLTFETFLIFDKSPGSPQGFPSGSGAFIQFVDGAESALYPLTDGFTLYHAPIDDYVGGQGEFVALSYDGFLAGAFGFSPILLFEVCAQDPVTTNNFPVANDLLAEAPFSSVGGTICAVTLTATDADLIDLVSFSITSPGTLGGTLVANGAPTTDGNGNWSQAATYTIPANQRGLDVFAFQVDDGQVTSDGTVTINVRGDAVQNTVAFGANSGNQFQTMRLYTGSPVPDGGTNGRRDVLVGQTFAQSTEFDNYAGVRHNPAGNLLALNLGPTGGAGSLYVYATQSHCDVPDDMGNVGGYLLATFSSTALPGMTDATSRVASLSVSPDNTRLAVQGIDTGTLYILNYSTGADVGLGGPDAASVSLAAEIDLSGSVYYENRTLGTAWYTNNRVLTVNPEGTLYSIDVTEGTAAALVDAPMSTAVDAISMADIEYNPELSPYVFVSVGQFDAGVTTNSLWVVDPSNWTIVPQSGGQMFTDYSNPALGAADETFREIGLDCLGNLFIGTFVNSTNRVNIKYLSNAINVAGIPGGAGSLVTWRTLATGESTSNFSGLDVAAATEIGSSGTCGTNPPTVANVTRVAAYGESCTITLTANNAEIGETLTFEVDNPGSGGGTLTPTGPVTQNGTTYSQDAVYTSAAGFRGSETFVFRANDGTQDSNNGTARLNVRGTIADGTVVYGGNRSDDLITMRAYYGQHVMNGGTAGASDILTGLGFAQSVEFDNYGGVPHNPAGNLLALNFGPGGGSGQVYVYATAAECQGNPATVLYTMPSPERIAGLAVNPSNNRIAVYGYDNRIIYVLNYTTGVDVGQGGSLAATITANTQVDVSAQATGTIDRTLGLAWLDDSTLLWTDMEGDLYTVTTGGVVTLRTTNPKPATNASLQFADVEYNPAVSPYVYVTVGEFSGTTTNTLYIVDPSTWSLVPQGGANANYTSHSTSANTFREVGLDSDGNLFVSVFNSNASLTNIEMIAGADVPASIGDNDTVNFSALPSNTTSSFNGLDVAAGMPEIVCALPGDFDGSGTVDGDDINAFVACYIAATGGPPTPGCECADTAAPAGVVNSADLTAFVADLLD